MTVKRIMALLMIMMLFGATDSFAKSKKKAPSKINKVVINSKGKDRVMRINASAYSLSKRETDGSPHVTATMERPIPGKTCAVSKDLEHLLGKRIFVVGENRILKVNDRMNKRYRKSIDIAWYSRKDALKFGRKDMTIVVLN